MGFNSGFKGLITNHIDATQFEQRCTTNHKRKP